MPKTKSEALRQLGAAIDADISLWTIEESVSQLLDLVPRRQVYEKEIQRFKSLKRQKEWLATRALFYSTESEQASITYQANGAPCLQGAAHSFISISHSQQYVCLLLAAHPATVDLETFSPKAWALKEKFMNEKEADAPAAVPPEQWATTIWSAKESVYKIAALPSLRFKEDIILSLQGNGDEGQLLAELPQYNRRYEVRYSYFPDFVLTVCQK